MSLTKNIMQRKKQNSINYIKKTCPSRTAVKHTQTLVSQEEQPLPTTLGQILQLFCRRKDTLKEDTCLSACSYQTVEADRGLQELELPQVSFAKGKCQSPGGQPKGELADFEGQM